MTIVSLLHKNGGTAATYIYKPVAPHTSSYWPTYSKRILRYACFTAEWCRDSSVVKPYTNWHNKAHRGRYKVVKKNKTMSLLTKRKVVMHCWKSFLESGRPLSTFYAVKYTFWAENKINTPDGFIFLLIQLHPPTILPLTITTRGAFRSFPSGWLILFSAQKVYFTV